MKRLNPKTSEFVSFPVKFETECKRFIHLSPWLQLLVSNLLLFKNEKKKKYEYLRS